MQISINEGKQKTDRELLLCWNVEHQGQRLSIQKDYSCMIIIISVLNSHFKRKGVP